MATIALLMTPKRGIVPATPEDVERCKSLQAGDVFYAKTSKNRNGRHHRKLMALFAFIAENHSKHDTLAKVKLAMKIKVGHYEEFIDEDGVLIYVPKSMEYGEMDQVEFDEFYKKAVDAAFDHFLPGMDRGEVNNHIERLLAWA